MVAYHSMPKSSLELENRRLKSLLKDLVQKAEDNERIHQKFSSLELSLLEASDINTLFQRLLETFPTSFQLYQVGLILLDPECTAQELISEDCSKQFKQQLRFVDSTKDLLSFFPNGIGLRLFLPTPAEIQDCFAKEPPIRSIASLPLERHGLLFGVLNLASLDPCRFDSTLATDFLNHLASIVSICIENAINQEQLRMLSLVDVLTRVKNRRCFNMGLTREITRANRQQESVSCLFIDLDFFKRINDNYGHQAGDKVLRAVANTIQNCLRKSDLLARYGGEEFVVLLPNTETRQAKQTAERIRKSIECHQLTFEQQLINITASIGVCTWSPRKSPGNIESIERALVMNTDQAVYRAKETGRNKVVVNHYSQPET